VREALRHFDDDFRWFGSLRMIQSDNGMLYALLAVLAGQGEASRAAGRALVDDIRRSASAVFRRVHEPAMVFTLARAAWLLADAPLLHEAVAAMAQARQRAEWPGGVAAHELVQALLAMAEGRFEAAATLLAGVGSRLDAYFLCAGVQARGLHAWACWRAGQADQARALLAPLLEGPGDDERGALLLLGVPALQGLLDAAHQCGWPSPMAERLTTLRDRGLAASGPAAGPVGDLPAAVQAAPLAAVSAATAGAAAATATAAAVDVDVDVAMPAADPASAPNWPGEPLTPRELEVLTLLAAGHSNKLIAQALALSVHTVKQHVASVLGKLAVASRGQAAAWWHARPH